MRRRSELGVCGDCVMALEYGLPSASQTLDELGLAFDEGFSVRFAGALASWGVGYEVHAAPSYDSHFSWAPCELCGTALGGDRYRAVVLTCDRHVGVWS
jgi:hypothetical protein